MKDYIKWTIHFLNNRKLCNWKIFFTRAFMSDSDDKYAQ